MAIPPLMFNKGDVIGGRYELHSLLGRGGFGEVYLAYDRSIQRACALKTIRTEFLADVASKQTFKKEALLWVNLDEHPFIVRALFVDEFSGRLFVEMDHISPDAWGRVSLADHLMRPNDSINIDRVLTWAIEFCAGMDHANRHGLQCHRDIKPSNILITQDGTLKISDFGLGMGAEALATARTSSFPASREPHSFGFSFLQHDGRGICGTLGYMAPEVILGKGSNIRSDIYSFGLVLWQMAASSPVPPFHSPRAKDADSYIRDVFQLQMRGHVPQGGGPIQEVIEQCLMPEPSQRPVNFASLQAEFERQYWKRTGRTFQIVVSDEKTPSFWNNKGASLSALGQQKEAIECFVKALEIDPRAAGAWSNKGIALRRFGDLEGAVVCFSNALAIDPAQPIFWDNKGLALHGLGRPYEALECFSRALKIDPGQAGAWQGKGLALAALGDLAKSIPCFSKAVEIDPRDALSWYNLGVALAALGRHEEEVACYSKVVEIDPLHAIAWNNKGATLFKLGRHAEAIRCFSRALEINPLVPGGWNNMGLAIRHLVVGQLMTPATLDRAKESLRCFSKAVEVNPDDALAWLNKAIMEGEFLDDRKSAVLSFQKYVQLARGMATESDRIVKIKKVIAEWSALA